MIGQAVLEILVTCTVTGVSITFPVRIRSQPHMTSRTQANSTPKVAVNAFGSEEAFLAAIDETIQYFNDGDIVEGTTSRSTGARSCSISATRQKA